MTDTSSTRMLDAYIEARVSPRRFLTGFFKLTEKGIHSSDYVEIDLKRGEPRIAIPVPNTRSGARRVESTKSSNKKFAPAIYDLETNLNVWSSNQRKVGESPFDDPKFRENAREEAFNRLSELEDMIKRSLEVQSSQILQTGKLVLPDQNNNTVYELDFQPKTTHFASVLTPWGADGSGDPESDIDAHATVVRRDGKQEPTDLIFGAGAKRRFIDNTKIKARADNIGLQRLQQFERPSTFATGGTLWGVVTLGMYTYRCWTYDDWYIDPVSDNPVRFVADNKVIMVAEAGRRDLTFGDIPIFVPPEARVQQFLPVRMTSLAEGFDLTTNIYVTPDGKNLTLTAGTRGLAIPTAVDTIGCLTVYP